jgi:hypothetical protein
MKFQSLDFQSCTLMCGFGFWGLLASNVEVCVTAAKTPAQVINPEDCNQKDY